MTSRSYNFGLSAGGELMRFNSVIIFLILPLSFVAHGATITVSPSGNDYAVIQKAIDAAHPRDIIKVQSGTYHENVNLNKEVTLRGVGNSVVDGGGKGSAINLSADGVILEGFKVKNVEICGIEINSNNNIIRFNNASDLGNSPGICLYECEGNIVTNNIATNNSEGFELDYSDGNEISYNVVSQLNKSLSTSGGITLVESNRNIIKGNLLYDNVFYGIGLAGYLVGSNKNTILDNTVSRSENGIVIFGCNENIIENNHVMDNQYGINITVNGPLNSTGNRIYRNSLLDNQFNAYDNTNETMAVAGSGPNRWDDDSRGNYYSDLNCIDGNSDGICDSPYDIPGGMSVDRYPLMSFPAEVEDYPSPN